MNVNRRGFTKLELIAVLLILTLLASLLLPAIQSMRESSRKIHCANNLRQIGVAIQNHESTRQKLPSLYNGDFRLIPLSAYDEFHSYSWRTAILPELELSNVSSQLDPNVPPTMPEHQEIINTSVPVFECSSTHSPGRVRDILAYNGGGPSTSIVGTAARSDYEAIGGVGIHEVSGLRPPYLATYEFGAWGEPRYIYAGDGLQPLSYRIARFRDISDGSTHFLANGTDTSIISALATRAFNETATLLP